MKNQTKVVCITGAGSGIGAAAARLFAKKGATVIATDIREESAREIADEIIAEGGKAEARTLNVTDHAAVGETVAGITERHGRLDVMVCNAGIGPKQMKKTADYTLEDWDSVVAVNQTGVFYCMQHALRQMTRQGSGNIVNVASLAGLKASGRNISYAASKFAVVGMTKAAALEYAASGIRINAVCPGYTESPLLDRLLSARPDMEEILKSVIPMHRFGKAEEIAEAIVWLASDQTGFMTGHTLTLDGGTSL